MGWMPVDGDEELLRKLYRELWYIRHPLLARKFQEEFERETDPKRKERMHQCLESNVFNFKG